MVIPKSILVLMAPTSKIWTPSKLFLINLGLKISGVGSKEKLMYYFNIQWQTHKIYLKPKLEYMYKYDKKSSRSSINIVP